MARWEMSFLGSCWEAHLIALPSRSEAHVSIGLAADAAEADRHRRSLLSVRCSLFGRLGASPHQLHIHQIPHRPRF